MLKSHYALRGRRPELLNSEVDMLRTLSPPLLFASAAVERPVGQKQLGQRVDSDALAIFRQIVSFDQHGTHANPLSAQNIITPTVANVHGGIGGGTRVPQRS